MTMYYQIPIVHAVGDQELVRPKFLGPNGVEFFLTH